MEKIDKAIEILEAIKNNQKVEILYGGEWRTYINNVSPLNFTNYEYRIFKEPAIKPYSNGIEFHQEALKHGMFVTYKNDNDCYFSIRMIHPKSEGVTINTSMASNGYVELDYNELLQKYQWADGSPCGVINENIESNDKTINVGFIREFMKKHRKTKYTINDDGTVDVDGSVEIQKDDVANGKLPFKFGKVSGDFDCSECELTSLEGAPRKIGGSFDCSYNKLSSLEGGPEEVGGSFYCSNNEELFSLEGAPQKIGSGNFEY